MNAIHCTMTIDVCQTTAVEGVTCSIPYCSAADTFYTALGCELELSAIRSNKTMRDTKVESVYE